MSEKKFTPGPWRVANGVQIVSKIHQIAKVWMMRDGEGKANARLIAAAPELHDALVNVTNWMETHRASGDAGFWDWDEDDEYGQAMSVLKKVRGEE